MWSYDHDKISKILIRKLDLDLSWQPARHGRPSLDSLALGRPPSDRWHLKMKMVVMEDRVGGHDEDGKVQPPYHLREGPNKQNTFFLGDLSQICLPTHPLQGFWTKGEIWVEKAIFGVIWEVFEAFGPCLGISHPTHPYLGEISPQKKFFCLLRPSLISFASSSKLIHLKWAELSLSYWRTRSGQP